MKYIFAALLAIGIYSCNSSDTPADTPAESQIDTTQFSSEIAVDSVLNSDMIFFFDSSGYSDHFKESVSSFDWNKFKLVGTWQEDSMYTRPFEPSENYFNYYGKLLRYSPDSNYFIDLDSYQIEIYKDKNGKLRSAENGPDTEITLVDTRNNTKTRLIFVGPSGSIEDGNWLNNSTLMLAGWNISDSDSLTAYIYKIHVPTNTYTLYELSDTAKAVDLMGSWRKERLKKLNIN